MGKIPHVIITVGYCLLFLVPYGYSAGYYATKEEVKELDSRVSHVEMVPQTTREQVHRVLVSEGVPQQLAVLNERSLNLIKIATDIKDTWEKMAKLGERHEERLDWIITKITDQTEEQDYQAKQLRRHSIDIQTLNNKVARIEKSETKKHDALINTAVQGAAIVISTIFLWWLRVFCKKRKLLIRIHKRLFNNRRERGKND